MRPDLPTGTVTFLFTDVEGSTSLLHELGTEAYAEALVAHRCVVREAVAEQGGVEVDTQGDAFFIAFPTAPGALAAAAAARDALAIPVRMGLHSGTPIVTDEGYVGPDVHRAALDRLEQTGQTQSVMRFLGAAARLWYLRSLWRESLQRLEGALAADERPTAARAKVLRAAGAMAVVNSDFETARHHIEQSLELNAALGDPQGLAYSRFLLGFAAVEEGDFARARVPLEQSLHEFRQLGDDYLEGIVAFNLAWAYEELGEFELARGLNEENLRRAEASGHDRLRFFSLTSLASDAERGGRPADALSMFQEVIRVAHGLDDAVHTSLALMRVASLIAATEAEPAANLLGCAPRVNEELGLDLPPYAAKKRDEVLTKLRGQLDEESLTRALQRGRQMGLEAGVALALEHRSLAE